MLIGLFLINTLHLPIIWFFIQHSYVFYWLTINGFFIYLHINLFIAFGYGSYVQLKVVHSYGTFDVKLLVREQK